VRWNLPQDVLPTAWFNAVPRLDVPLQPPLHPATRLERALDTPARIYYKDESVSAAGSRKPNTAVPQACYNQAEGVPRLTTETGAGQWGSALSFAGALFGLECKVYMVRASYDQKPYRRTMMETWGGEVVASPVDEPGHPGSLGTAISDAVRDAAAREDSHYALGSCGGGSNLGGIALPFLEDRATELLAVEPTSCPTLTAGTFEYDFGDVAGMTPLLPLLPMFTLGHELVPPPIHAGGLRYHGDAPVISSLVHSGRMRAVAYPQDTVFEAAVQFARTEGTIPAPETSHAIRAVVDEAVAARESGEEQVILFNYSGHGLLDLGAYEQYFRGAMEAE